MSDFISLQEFERSASATGIFKGVEIDLLHETLLSWKSSPGKPYTVLELRDGKTLAAYAISCKITGRDSTYDIRYFVVDRDYRHTEGGRHLLALIDQELLKAYPYAVIRAEFSTRKLIGLGAKTLEDAGYRLIGHIKDYHGEGDDYYYFIHVAYRHKPVFEKPELDIDSN